MATLPDNVGLDVSLEHTEQPTNTFLIDWSSGQIIGLDDGLEAMRQAVDIILQNERFHWQIYDSNFETELEDLVGEEYDYIVDAVDTVTAKISLVMKAKEKGVPIISSMGAGNKLDASQFKVADIYKTKVCPLAKVMRRELKKRGVRKLKVVYSEEIPTRPIEDMSISCRTHCICPPGAKHKCTERRDIPGSVAFVPSVAGLIIAGEVVKDLCKP